MSGLFRDQVIERHHHRLYGSIVIDSPVWAHAATALACASLAALIGFLCLFSVSRTEEVTGQLVPDMGILQLSAPQRGVIVDLSVNPGQIVAAGDVIAVVSGERTTAKGETQQAVTRLIEQRLASVLAESATLGRSFEEKSRALRERKRSLGEELGHIRIEMELHQRRSELARENQRRMQDLQAQGFVSAALVEERGADTLEQAARLAASRRSAAEIEARLEQALAEERELPLQEQREREQLERMAADLRQQQAENEARRELVVRAPQAGRIVGVAVRRGQSLAPEAEIASLVPANSSLQAELAVPSRSMAFVRIGTPVWLRYDAYPHPMFGQQLGTVAGIDVGVVAADGRVSHRVRVHLASQQLNVSGGQSYDLMAGLTVNASVRLEEHRLVEWLFAPLRRWAAPATKDTT
jgi:membrane fusion protein